LKKLEKASDKDKETLSIAEMIKQSASTIKKATIMVTS